MNWSGIPPFGRIGGLGGEAGMRPAKGGDTSRMTQEVLSSLAEGATRALEGASGFSSLSSPYVATGKSGVKHRFTFGNGEGGAVDLVADVVSSSGPVDETGVLSLFIKVYDVGAKRALICAIPSLSGEAKKLSGLYKIVTVEAPDFARAVDFMAEALKGETRP